MRRVGLDGKKKKIQPYLSPGLFERFKKYVDAHGLTDSGVVEEALIRFLDDRYDNETLLKRLGVVERQGHRIEGNMSTMLEAFTLFIKIWYSHTPELGEEDKEAARERASLRFDAFLDALRVSMSGTKRGLMDDLVRDKITDPPQ